MERIFEISIRGKGGHGSMPSKANNPILIAAGLIEKLEAEVRRVRAERGNAQLPEIRLLGFDSGKKANIIPERAKLWLEIRTASEKQEEKLSGKLTGIIEKHVQLHSAEVLVKPVAGVPAAAG